MGLRSHVQDLTDGIKQPSMRIDLLLILSLQDENDLHGYQVIGIILMRKHKLRL